MGRRFAKLRRDTRLIIQLAYTAATNGHFSGFLKGRIYTGPLKSVCVPGLNCYSCPGALGACPLGSLQSALGSRTAASAFYVVGLLIVFGLSLGRLICGWLCPFGLIQDLVYRIPWLKKRRKLPGERALRRIKYILLAVLVVLLPLTIRDITGLGTPWFCKLVCPAGTLQAALPLAASSGSVRSILGPLFWGKLAVLVVVLYLSLIVWRPFCRYLCPLGALYGACNGVSLYRMEVDRAKCIDCGACQKACGMDIPVMHKPNHVDCVRCGRCKSVCPHGALSSGFGIKAQEPSASDRRESPNTEQ